MATGDPNRRSVVHINTHDIAGGAAKTAWRLALSQRRAGWKAELVVGHRYSNARFVHAFDVEVDADLDRRCRARDLLFYAFQGSHRLDGHPVVDAADLIHLHNLHGDYFNPFSLYPLARSKPVIWTLHDMQAITGHCAHAFDCERWTTGCGDCPYLDTEPALTRDTTRQLLQDKARIYAHSPLWIVSPSRWLLDKVSRSVLGDHPAVHIPNGIDPSVFRPWDRREARESLGLSPTQLLVGAVSHGGTLANPWKGGAYTEAAIDFLCAADPNIRFVNIGGSGDTSDPRVTTVGHVSDESALARAYSALDLFLYTPRADNCPLVVLEAMACGLPVVSFDTGGVPELVGDGSHGHVVPFQDVNALVRSARHLLDNIPMCRAMGLAARERVMTEFTLERMTERYLTVYEKAICDRPRRRMPLMPLAAVPELVRTPAFEAATAAVSEIQSAPVPLTPDRFDAFCISRQWHFDVFKPAEVLYGRSIDPKHADLKTYQDLLVYTFIVDHIPPGSRLLEVGGGDSRVLKALAATYECWNVDRLEGLGSGPTQVTLPPYRLVRAYMGEFNPAIPDGYFDLVFSISALEHSPDDAGTRERICQDIDRVMAPGGYSLHLFDVRLRGADSWTHGLLPHMYLRYDTRGRFSPLAVVDQDPDLYHMTRTAYDHGWRHITGQSFDAFGKPASYNVLWRKSDDSNDTAALEGIGTCSAARNVQNETCETGAPRITLVTPSLNQGAYIEACIRSVLDQDYANLEYLIMDGGSTDGSVAIIERYAHRLSHWQSGPDGGQYAAIQAGFDQSSGEIMGWLNADDMLHPRALETVARIFRRCPEVQWIMGRPTVWDAAGRVVHVVDPLLRWSRTDYLRGRYKDPHIQQESTFWRRQLWERAGGCLDPSFSLAADMELWSRFFRHADLVSVDARLGGFRVHGDQKTATSMDRYNQEARAILERQRIWAAGVSFPADLPAPEPIGMSIMTDSTNDHPVQTEPCAPRVSVIVSTYADAEFIGECLEDLVTQTMAGEMEIIVIDAASPEGEGEIVARFARQHSRIRYHRTDTRISVYAAWNRAVRMAAGRYIMPMSANDRLAPDACRRLADALDASPGTALVYGDTHVTHTPHETFGSHTRTGTLRWPPYDYDDLLANNRIGPHPMWRRSLHETIGFFDERFDVVADQEWFLRIGWDHPMAHLDTVTGLYFWHDDALSVQGERPLAENRRIRDFYLHRSIFRAQCRLGKRADLVAGRTSVIVLTRNNRSLTQACLSALKTHTPADLEVIVVDNGSTDGTAAWLAANPFEFHRFELISNDGNNGFSRGNNQGLARVTGEAVVLLNNDVVVTAGWLDRLATPARKNPRIGLVGPMTNAVAGPQRLAHVSYDPATLDGLDSFSDQWARRHGGQVQFIGRPVGFCLWVHRSVIDRIGGLDERFGPGNFEDDDFCLRAAIAGYQSVIARDCFVHHFGSRTFASEGIDASDGLSANWSVFKAKWGLPESLPYGRYDMHPFLTADFQHDIHYLAPVGTPDVPSRAATNAPNTEVTPMSHALNIVNPSTEAVSYDAIHSMIAGERFDAAVSALESFISVHPDHGQAHADLGGLYHRLGRTDMARQHLEKAAALLPEDAAAQKQLGDFYYVVLNEVALAKKAYRASLAADDRNMDVLMICGHLCATDEDWQGAADFYRQALSVEPWFGEARTYLDAVERRMAEARTQVSRESADADPIAQRIAHLASNPDDAVAHNDLGVLYYRAGDRVAARRHYEQAVALAPDHPVFRKNLADFYYVEDGNADGAMAIYRAIATADPDDVDARLGMAVIQADSGDTDSARKIAQTILDRDPENADARTLADQLGPASVDQQSAEQRHAEIVSRMADGDPRMIAAELETLLEDAPNCGPAWMTLGRLRFDMADGNGAVEALSRAVDQMPESAEAIKLLADAQYVGRQDLETAIAGYNRALVLDPDNLDLMLTLAHLHVTREEFAKARPLYERVAAADPAHGDVTRYLDAVTRRLASTEPPDAVYGRIQTMIREDRLDESLDALTELVAVHPDYAPAHNDLGVLYYRRGEMDAAEAHYATAARLTPGNLTYQKNLADFTVVVRHRFEAALAIYVRILTDAPNDIETLMATGHICASLERLDDAEHFYQRVLEIEPWNTEVRSYLDAVLDRRSAPAAAAPIPEAAAGVSELNVEALFAKAQTLMADGRRTKARELLAQAVAADPLFAAAHNDLGVLSYRDNDLDAAVRSHAKAVALAPDNAVYRLNLADVYAVGCGRFGDALEQYLTVLQEDPYHGEALLNIAQVCLCLDRLDDAVHFLDRVLETEPWHADARTLMDRVHDKRRATAC